MCTQTYEAGHNAWITGLSYVDIVHRPQAELARRLPFCFATLLGTHNSAITLADGYGNRDEYFQQYFKWIKWVVRP